VPLDHCTKCICDLTLTYSRNFHMAFQKLQQTQCQHRRAPLPSSVPALCFTAFKISINVVGIKTLPLYWLELAFLGPLLNLSFFMLFCFCFCFSLPLCSVSCRQMHCSLSLGTCDMSILDLFTFFLGSGWVAVRFACFGDAQLLRACLLSSAIPSPCLADSRIHASGSEAHGGRKD
jgi:hypothetical protein